MDRVRLEQLKEKNRAFVRRKRWEGYELFQDCVRSLGEVRLIEDEEDIRGLIHSMCGCFPLDEYRHIQGARPAAVDELNFGTDQTWYIVWDDAALPAVAWGGGPLPNGGHDLFAVAFDTYIFNGSFTEIVHRDSLGRLWRYP
ncbi:hypothetical protein [Enterocloster lavalensis]|uniref:hypothetical protein n=1 Tax=Enterocloster lavalensis TaxID=460384 RepID=UPI0023F4CD9F|nr:hypothetical protein [Enterocloster lavalensis]